MSLLGFTIHPYYECAHYTPLNYHMDDHPFEFPKLLVLGYRGCNHHLAYIMSLISAPHLREVSLEKVPTLNSDDWKTVKVPEEEPLPIRNYHRLWKLKLRLNSYVVLHNMMRTMHVPNTANLRLDIVMGSTYRVPKPSNFQCHSQTLSISGFPSQYCVLFLTQCGPANISYLTLKTEDSLNDTSVDWPQLVQPFPTAFLEHRWTRRGSQHSRMYLSICRSIPQTRQYRM